MSKYFYPGDIKSATTLLGHRKFLAPAHPRHYTLGNTRMRCVTERVGNKVARAQFLRSCDLITRGDVHPINVSRIS